MEKVLYYKIEVDTGDANRKLLGEMTAQLKVLNDEYKKLISSKEKDVSAIGRNREQVSALTKDINTLSKAIVTSTAASAKDAAEKIKFANDVKNANNKLEQAYVQSEAKKASAAEKEAISIKNAQNKLEEAYTKAEAKIQAKIQANTFEAGSIAALRQELSKATLAYDRMGEAERNSAAGKQLETSIALQVQALNKLEQATGRFQRQVGNYNTAGVAMSQVLREIPAFTFSAQTGILALSNNIPILVDEMKKVAGSIDAVTGKKAGFVGALKSMASNIFSLGGIMTIALGLFTIFSKQIFEAMSGTEELTDAQKDLQKQIEDTNRLVYENTIGWMELRGEITGLSSDLLLLEYDYKKTLAEIKKAEDKSVKEAEGNASRLGYFFKALIMQRSGYYSIGAGELEKREIIRIQKETNDAIDALNNEYEAKRDAAKRRDEERKKGKKGKKDKELEELKKLQKEILELDRANTQQQIDNVENDFRRELLDEENRHKIFVEDTKARMDVDKKLDKELKRSLQTEEETHTKNIQDIKNKAIAEQSIIQQKASDRELQQQKEASDAWIAQLLAEVEAMNEADKKASDEKIAKEKKDADEIKRVKQNLWGSLSEAENLYFQMQEDALQRHLRRQIRAIDQDSTRQTDILKNRLDKGLISEAQYNADKAELDRKAEESKQKAEREAFEKQKKLAKAKIAVDASIAIVKGYAEMNWIAATIQGVALTGLAAAQIAAVDAQEFAQGGLVLDKNKNIPTKPNGDSVLTTLTPGEIVLNKQQQAMLGGNATFARIGVPNVPNIYPNSSSGGSMSSVSKKDFQMMFNQLGSTINSKKVYQLESESRRTRTQVENYESSNRW